MKSLFSIIFYIQNGIIAAPSAAVTRQQWWMTTLLDQQAQIKALETQDQKMETLARTLMDENANLMRQIETKTEQYAYLEARIAAVEQENEIENEEKQNQFVTESKLNGINRKEPVIAFRATSVKDSDQDNLSRKAYLPDRKG